MNKYILLVGIGLILSILNIKWAMEKSRLLIELNNKVNLLQERVDTECP